MAVPQLAFIMQWRAAHQCPKAQGYWRALFLNVSRVFSGSGRRAKRRCACSAAWTSVDGWEAPARTQSTNCFGGWRTPQSLQAVRHTSQERRQRNNHRDTALRNAKRSANRKIQTNDDITPPWFTPPRSARSNTVSVCSVHHWYSGSVSSFHVKTVAMPAFAVTRRAGASWHQGLRRSRRARLSGWVECKDTSMLKPLSDWTGPKLLTTRHESQHSVLCKREILAPELGQPHIFH